eukprot:6179166-Pleurochrysis_carterae.AAC.2
MPARTVNSRQTPQCPFLCIWHQFSSWNESEPDSCAKLLLGVAARCRGREALTRLQVIAPAVCAYQRKAFGLVSVEGNKGETRLHHQHSDLGFSQGATLGRLAAVCAGTDSGYFKIARPVPRVSTGSSALP